ncbi:hypothetical protein EPI10_002731 [Gossypium australe]|uniref:Retrovirus-related Pol polyprotein from transposon TNT 1-94 n=1 Tax=Gossypium australe TaxID=47621 RepID=A0A5B6VFA0_9ROSI|nr:hypothetical protein EPI10_002731 [Gossypium australe]
MVALKRILSNLGGTVGHGLMFRPSTRLSLVGYVYANWGLDFDDRRSTTGYYIYFGDNPISWCSRKQQVVSRSSTEAEYRGLAAQHLMSHNNLVVSGTTSANPVLHSKFKHVELDLFFVREKVAASSLLVGEVSACDQVADILTKPLSASLFARFRSLLRVLEVWEDR